MSRRRTETDNGAEEVDPIDALRDAVDRLKRFYPEMNSAAVVLYPGGDMPHVVIPVYGNRVPNAVSGDCDRFSYVGKLFGG